MALNNYIKYNYVTIFRKLLQAKPFSSNSASNGDQLLKTSYNQENIINSVTATEDLSDITPFFRESFNLAAYANSSETLQQLIKLNVNLNKIEKKPYVAEKLLKLDLNSKKDHIVFLSNYVDMGDIGLFITKNPLIFYERLDDLNVRINYLMSKKFNNDQIKQIISRNPFWLMFSTVRIDRRLGYFQDKFSLNGEEMRCLTVTNPKLITYSLKHVQCNLFIIKEEMGFEDHEIKQLILVKPKLLMLNDKALLQRFDYIHNMMKVSHSDILNNPELLLCRNFILKQRHMFLQSLGRAQYNPKKENFVPLKSLIEDTDVEFCKKYAKCNVTDFNDFLKTL